MAMQIALLVIQGTEALRDRLLQCEPFGGLVSALGAVSFQAHGPGGYRHWEHDGGGVRPAIWPLDHPAGMPTSGAPPLRSR